MALGYAFDWSELMSGFLGAQGELTSLGVAYLEFSCLNTSLGNTFVMESLAYIFGPIGMIFTVLLGSLGKAYCEKRQHDRPAHSFQDLWRNAVSSSVGVATLVLYLLQVRVPARQSEHMFHFI